LKTGTNRLAVDDYRTCPALAFSVTGLFRAGQPQVISQQIEKNPIRPDDELVLASVDLHYHLVHYSSFSLRTLIFPG
jgi:hypothetical protein